MNAQQVAKLTARTEHLLDLFISLLEKYAMLRPLAFDPDLVNRWAKGPPARGLIAIRNALLASCVQDVHKVALDKSDRAPSIRNILSTIEDGDVRALLREKYATAPPVLGAKHKDPSVQAMLDNMQKKEQAKRQDQFDAEWADVSERWSQLEGGDALDAFKTWRDKLIAHSDLHHKDGEYHLLDLTDLGLKWGDLGDLVTELQSIVDSINLLVRSANFAFDELATQLEEASNGFWRP